MRGITSSSMLSSSTSVSISIVMSSPSPPQTEKGPTSVEPLAIFIRSIAGLSERSIGISCGTLWVLSPGGDDQGSSSAEAFVLVFCFADGVSGAAVLEGVFDGVVMKFFLGVEDKLIIFGGVLCGVAERSLILALGLGEVRLIAGDPELRREGDFPGVVVVMLERGGVIRDLTAGDSFVDSVVFATLAFGDV